MAGKRYKLHGEAVFDSAHDERRFDTLVEKIRAYEPGLDQNALLSAFHWSSKRYNARTAMPPVRHQPLDVLERMVDLGRADSNTLLAAIVYPAVQPNDKGEMAESDFGAVRERYGDAVHNTVCATLAFSQIEYRPLITQSKKSGRLPPPEAARYHADQAARQKKHLRDFRYMALWASTKYVKNMPSAILIRGVEYLLDVEQIRKVKEPSDREELLLKIKDIYADIVYLGGFRNVQEALMNEWLRFKEPTLYQQIQEVRNEQIGTGHGKKKQVMETREARLREALGMAGFLNDNYEIEMHLKTPWSIYKKMREKNIGINDLPNHIRDFVQARIIIDVDNSQQTQTSRNVKTDYALCTRAHHALTARYDNAKGPYKDPFNPKLFVLKDGTLVDSIDLVRDKDQIQWVSRFKDYMKEPNEVERTRKSKRIYTPVYGPKRNGYRAMHDTLIMDGGEIDVQIVTKEDHQRHLYGAAAHGGFKAAEYKSEATADQPLVQWYRAVRNMLKPGEKPVGYVGAFVGDSSIVMREGPMNVAELAGGIHVSKAADCIGAMTLSGGGPYGDGDIFPAAPVRDANGFYPVDAEVRPGMSVQLLLAEGAFRSQPKLDRIVGALKRNRADRRRLLQYVRRFQHS
jgi:ppGpp synthetase/RelA/SpoT-type nucleotidyltranferase